MSDRSGVSTDQLKAVFDRHLPWGFWHPPLTTAPVVAVACAIFTATIVTVCVLSAKFHWINSPDVRTKTLEDGKEVVEKSPNYWKVPMIIGIMGGGIGNAISGLLTGGPTFACAYHIRKKKQNRLKALKRGVNEDNLVETWAKFDKECKPRETQRLFEQATFAQMRELKNRIGLRRFKQLVKRIDDRNAGPDALVLKWVWGEASNPKALANRPKELDRFLQAAALQTDAAQKLQVLIENKADCAFFQENPKELISLIEAMKDLSIDQLKARSPSPLSGEDLKKSPYLARGLVRASTEPFQWPAKEGGKEFTLRRGRDSFVINSKRLKLYLPQLHAALKSPKDGRLSFDLSYLHQAEYPARSFVGVPILIEVLNGERSIHDLSESERRISEECADFFGGEILLHALSAPTT